MFFHFTIFSVKCNAQPIAKVEMSRQCLLNVFINTTTRRSKTSHDRRKHSCCVKCVIHSWCHCCCWYYSFAHHIFLCLNGFFSVATYVCIKVDDIFIVSLVIVVVYIAVLKCQQSSPIPGGCNSWLIMILFFPMLLLLLLLLLLRLLLLFIIVL